ncbi:TPA: xanthine dehydrogenase family protein subunit M [Burkholderia vietnamiensis]|nr:xanthine dehydrogenase family protein subunit M [Burkholderia vietnamiensis]HDR8980663.1 xanthine dehydrogenase family protein subunit M [Burkholderia vietnamiensis]
MKFPAFAYARPGSVCEAIELLAADEDAKALAGGQSLLPILALRLSSPSLLVDLGGLDELSRIEVCGGRVHIGAMVTHAHNAASPENLRYIPLIVQALQHVAHEAVRNRGTLGGSLANADASAEMPLVMVALDATMVLAGPDGERTVAADAFFQGHYSTAIESGELLIRVEVPFSNLSWAFEEVSRRPGDFALSMVAAGVRVEGGYCREARIVMGGVGDRPLRANEAEDYLVNKRLDADAIGIAAQLAVEPVKARSDIHASAEYRRSVTKVLVRRALERTAEGSQS